MRMMKVQFGPDEGCFVAVVSASDFEDDDSIVERASAMVRNHYRMLQEHLEESGTPVVTDVTDDGVVYDATEM